jgi:cytochrome c553
MRCIDVSKFSFTGFGIRISSRIHGAHSMRGLILGLAALVVTSPFVQAAGDSAAGRTVMVKCQVCHGKDGLGTVADAPNIAGQKYDYLLHSLMAYKTGQRRSAAMAAAVNGLSKEDIANVAAYYAAIKFTVEVPQ